MTSTIDDQITSEVIRGALLVAAEEASIVVVRSAHSTFIQEGADACAAILDAECQLVALSTATSLMHAASLRCSLPALLEEFPLETMRPGDVYALNDPYRGGIHANDVAGVPAGVRRRTRRVLRRHADPHRRRRRRVGRRARGAGDRHVRGGPHAAARAPVARRRARQRRAAHHRRQQPRRPTRRSATSTRSIAGANTIGRRIEEMIEQHGADDARPVHPDWIDTTERRMRDELDAHPGRHLPRQLHHRRRRLRAGQALPRRRRGHRGRRRDRDRLQRHVDPVGRRDQRVVLADDVGRDLRGAVPRGSRASR